MTFDEVDFVVDADLLVADDVISAVGVGDVEVSSSSTKVLMPLESFV